MNLMPETCKTGIFSPSIEVKKKRSVQLNPQDSASPITNKNKIRTNQDQISIAGAFLQPRQVLLT